MGGTEAAAEATEGAAETAMTVSAAVATATTGLKIKKRRPAHLRKKETMTAAELEVDGGEDLSKSVM